MAESLEDYEQRIDRWLWKAGYDSGEINDFIVENTIQKEFILALAAAVTVTWASCSPRARPTS